MKLCKQITKEKTQCRKKAVIRGYCTRCYGKLRERFKKKDEKGGIVDGDKQ